MRQKTLIMIITMMALLVAVSMSGCTTGSVTVSPSASAPASASAGASLSAGLPDSSSYNITITGGKVSPVTLTYADLKAMKMTELSATMVKMNGVDVTSDWVGVPLADVLAKAGVPEGNVTFKIAAPDGFVTTYTGDQLNGSIIGLKRNGTALDDNVGGDNPIQLVVPGGTGHMWIKVPVNVEIDAA